MTMVRKAISEAVTETVDFLVDHGVDSDIAMDAVMGLFQEIDGAMVNYHQIKDDYFSLGSGIGIQDHPE